jgi:hypothetical protein
VARGGNAADGARDEGEGSGGARGGGAEFVRAGGTVPHDHRDSASGRRLAVRSDAGAGAARGGGKSRCRVPCDGGGRDDDLDGAHSERGARRR